jgi:hypothetical protein
MLAYQAVFQAQLLVLFTLVPVLLALVLLVESV